MRLYDWMLNPEIVIKEGELISDRHVILNQNSALAIGMRVLTGEDGMYELRATKAPTRTGDVSKDYRGKLQKLLKKHCSPEDGWSEIVWSAWHVGSKGRTQVTIGSLGGEPVGVNAEWLTRLPEGYVLEGREPNEPLRVMRIRQDTPARGKSIRRREPCGIVAAVKLLDVTDVHWAVAASLAGPDGKPKKELMAR